METREPADNVEPCGLTTQGDLPWPLSAKLLPDEEKADHVRSGPVDKHGPIIPAGKTRLCQARFNYKGNIKPLQWQGPRGGNALIDIVRNAYGVDESKLIYLTDGRSNDVLDVDAPLSEAIEYHVRVEPEDSTGFNIVPCLVNLCTFNYAGCAGTEKAYIQQ
eukprot:CAMPEP_0181298440 /NCGR_PEP_ID=MMETSP1101-20121128/5782_1 /TAXON_ID=46948 /ORGANISM="Rhodomonas abbreviata, Strain Caron Lab Isolate" /LENGTH=161 /DNA_ID=CAMNT_0023403459 /DNA_START=72 /DNA_END=557 /DNA_ORIENTATION=+